MSIVSQLYINVNYFLFLLQNNYLMIRLQIFNLYSFSLFLSIPQISSFNSLYSFKCPPLRHFDDDVVLKRRSSKSISDEAAGCCQGSWSPTTVVGGEGWTIDEVWDLLDIQIWIHVPSTPPASVQEPPRTTPRAVVTSFKPFVISTAPVSSSLLLLEHSPIFHQPIRHSLLLQPPFLFHFPLLQQHHHQIPVRKFSSKLGS